MARPSADRALPNLDPAQPRRREAELGRARPFPKGERAGQFVVLASGFANDNDEGGGDALPIHTDARVVAATMKAGETAEYHLGTERRACLVPATGAVEIEGQRVNARDGAAIEDSELVLVDAA